MKLSTSLSSVAVALALLIGVALASPQRAAAQYYPPDYGAWPAVIVATPPSLFVLGMTIADTVSFAEHKPFGDVLAVGDLVTGSLVTIGAGIFLGVAIGNSNGSSTSTGPFWAAGGIGLALGVYELVHAIWSFQHNDDPPAGTPMVAVAPTHGGLELSVGGAF